MLTMKLSQSQLYRLSIAGRTASSLSLLGVATIFTTFTFSEHFRGPTHRIMLINGFYNLFDFIATMISVSGPEAGDDSALCRFQAFSLQMFPVADVLWTVAMTWDVVLVVFYHYEPERLRRLEKKYIVVITTLTFVPAFVFLFIRNAEKGPLYGSVQFWCSISPNWVLFRIIFYYAPIWLLILGVLILYIVIGHELFQLRHELMLTSNDCLALSSRTSPSNESVRRTNRDDMKDLEGPIIRQQSAVSLRKFLLMPILYFLALLATWVAPTINRVYAFRHPGKEPYPLMMAVATLGSLRGFWNGIIFISLRSKARR
ncbi:putative cAMP receptor (Car4) [Aspergillus lucknowensis]|uniref:G-protein coupled receptors family 2 profile 2 domain-containing protein n=1 Tax=Aspergillus lucknowensis TaxID=176173 RepID=A0ABR4LWU5_9EURO